MPATGRGISSADYVLGVDGCRAGWIFAQRFPLTGEMRVAISDSFASVLTGPGMGAAAVIIDIPIGLSANGRRGCEKEARRALGKRRSSVFSAPSRETLRFANYAEANAFGKSTGAGVSCQCWGIAPKIREVDALMTPDLQDRIGEGHPELAFTRLKGEPCRWSKKTQDGAHERVTALEANGLRDIGGAYELLRKAHLRRSDFEFDDFLDACALALTAEARLSGSAWRMGDGECDSRGLKMEIWG
jgi:predicted RNase H-like nuclease